MLTPTDVFQLSDEQNQQADKMEAYIEAAITKAHSDDPSAKAFTFKTAVVSKEIGGLDVKTRNHVVENATEAGWKVAFDEKAGELTLTAKRQRKTNKPKTDVPA